MVERKRNSSDNRVIKVFLTKRGEKVNNSIEIQLEKIGDAIERQLNDDLKGEIIEAGVNLNWAIIKHLNR